MATIIYSVTIHIKKEVESHWVQYMKRHVLDVINTNCFKDFFIRKIMAENLDTSLDAIATSTYIIEYHCSSMDKLQYYFDHYAEALKNEHNEKFKDQFTATRTILEEQFDKWYELMPMDQFVSKVW